MSFLPFHWLNVGGGSLQSGKFCTAMTYLSLAAVYLELGGLVLIAVTSSKILHSSLVLKKRYSEIRSESLASHRTLPLFALLAALGLAWAASNDTSDNAGNYRGLRYCCVKSWAAPEAAVPMFVPIMLAFAAAAFYFFRTYSIYHNIYEIEGTATSTSNRFLFVNFVSILVLPPITWGGYYLSSSTQSHPISLLRSLSFSLNSLLCLMLDVFIQASYSYIVTETFFSENTTALTRFLLRCVAHGFFVQLSIEAVWQYSVRMKNKFGIPEDKASLNIIFYIAMLMTYGRFMQFAATDAYSAVMLEVAGLIAELNTLDKLLQGLTPMESLYDLKKSIQFSFTKIFGTFAFTLMNNYNPNGVGVPAIPTTTLVRSFLIMVFSEALVTDGILSYITANYSRFQVNIGNHWKSRRKDRAFRYTLLLIPFATCIASITTTTIAICFTAAYDPNTNEVADFVITSCPQPPANVTEMLEVGSLWKP
ncbi:hypothetical protein TeGR_g5321 [Tetraparma gracilis]|uniref:Uncharacterized protein n=1 Tax=Tetraparma gracilis TaxID=2962635 RepID=A0ABQ6N2D8_9STRA|nr:hypothetical protein TeGR_g5321 [Tetraparma gracilis]